MIKCTGSDTFYSSLTPQGPKGEKGMKGERVSVGFDPTTSIALLFLFLYLNCDKCMIHTFYFILP